MERNIKNPSLLRTVLLHHAEELDNDLRAGADEDLALSRFLGIVDAVQGIVEDGSLNHFDGPRFSDRRIVEMRYLQHLLLAFMDSEHGECPHDGPWGSSARSSWESKSVDIFQSPCFSTT